jgi:hypothetical protein
MTRLMLMKAAAAVIKLYDSDGTTATIKARSLKYGMG